jgi:preprotein translocase subunit SecD
MNPNLKWKFLFIAGIIVACLVGLLAIPKFPPKSLKDVKDNLAHQLKLGLDLQGGTHLILQVQMQEALSADTDQVADHLTRTLREKEIRFGSVSKAGDTQILVSEVPPEQSATFSDLVRTNYSMWDASPAPGTTNGYLLTRRATDIAARKAQIMDQSVETIRRRIDALGLTEPDIREHGRGDYEILVQLPGEGDPTRAKAVIQAGGKLELKLVQGDREFNSEAEAYQSYSGVLPAGTELVRGRSEASTTSGATAAETWFLLERRAAVGGSDLRGATTSPSTKYPGFYDVNFSLSVDAGKRFGAITEANVGRKLAIVLDRKVVTAPVINSRIEDSGMIEGRFGRDEAQNLALVLRAGALPASIKYLEERTVGPSLGADSIRQGLQASLVSLVVVIVFMVLYYRLAGVNAVVALILNLVVLLACLAYFRAVLTLPGIAGVILTIGMGVDSNVLVFERIREELRAGKAPASAVEAGFDRAFLTIIDTHVTTVVSSLFLFIFGTGPVRGFAVSLVIGLVANLFTAIYVSRTLFGWHLSRMSRDAKLSI